MSLLRPLVLTLLTHQISFRAVYLSAHANVVADGLSHSQVQPSFLEEHQLQSHPDPILSRFHPGNLKL